MVWFRINGPGLALVLGLSCIAAWLGSLLPVVGGPVFGILIGMLLGNTWGRPAPAVPGILFSSKKVLQWAVIVLGAGISLGQVWHTGVESLSVMLITLAAAFLAAYGFGRWMGVPSNLKSLIGVGTAICGGSAIAAVSPIVEAKEEEIAYSISTIFLFNVIAVLIFPPLGHWMGFSDEAFGLWAGTAINDTSSVVAAGYVYSDAAGEYATIVKLTRTMMIIPICLLFALLVGMRKKREMVLAEVAAGGAGDIGSSGTGGSGGPVASGDSGTGEVASVSSVNGTGTAAVSGVTPNKPKPAFKLGKIFPWFILWFLVASLLNTMGLFPGNSVHFIGILGKFMIVMALTAVGLGANFRKMLGTGIKPLVLGLITWFVVALVSVLVQMATGSV
jgi:uncharacterized membrane protein YadS